MQDSTSLAGRYSPKSALLRVVALAVLFSAAAVYEAASLSAFSAPQLWLHLRTGLWMLQNHALPRTGLFSQYSNLSWHDPSWLFDLLLGGAYRLLGLRAIAILLMLLKVALAVVTFLLARAMRVSWWAAVALSALAQYAIAHLQPVPSVVSILFFALEFRLLIRSRATGSTRDLFWLPPLFLLWANGDNQFGVGLILLGLFLISLLIEQALRMRHPVWISPGIVPVNPARVGAVTVLSLLATFVTPYGFHLLPEGFKALYSDVGFEHFSEMSAIAFRTPQEYVLMLMVMIAFLTLGRRRSLALFELMILLAGTALAFRIERDSWIAVLAAIAIIPSAFTESDCAAESLQRSLRGGIAATAVIVLIAPLFVPRSDVLMARIARNFPVAACNYIREHHLPPPLFNAYSWGSFLTWYLPEYPVDVDSRVELYGSDRPSKYFDVIGGKERLESYPDVSRAGTLLLERESAMAKALTTLPALSARYRLVYSDDLADVFVPVEPPLQ